jgi:hypothetical protein
MGELRKRVRLEFRIPREKFAEAMALIIGSILRFIPDMPIKLVKGDGCITLEFQVRFPWTWISCTTTISHRADAAWGTDIEVTQLAKLTIPAHFQNHFTRPNVHMAMYYAKAFENGKGLEAVFASLGVLNSAMQFYEATFAAYIQHYWLTDGSDGVLMSQGYRVLPMLKEFSTEKGSILAQPIEYLGAEKWGWKERGRGQVVPISAKKPMQFVVSETGQVVVGTTGHSNLFHYINSRPVFAGEVTFNKGVLVRWTNGSGHFAPFAGLLYQAPFHIRLFQNISSAFNVQDALHVQQILSSCLRVPIENDVVLLILELIYPSRRHVPPTRSADRMKQLAPYKGGKWS